MKEVGKVSWLRVEVLEGIKCKCVVRRACEGDILAGFVEAQSRASSAQRPECSALVMDPVWVCVCTVRMGPCGVHCARWEQTRITSQESQTPRLFKEQTGPTGCEMLGEPGSSAPPFQPTSCPPLGPPPLPPLECGSLGWACRTNLSWGLNGRWWWLGTLSACPTVNNEELQLPSSELFQILLMYFSLRTGERL